MAYLIYQNSATPFQPKIKYRKLKRPIRDNGQVLPYRISRNELFQLHSWPFQLFIGTPYRNVYQLPPEVFRRWWQ